jgi:hypothetical protein
MESAKGIFEVKTKSRNVIFNINWKTKINMCELNKMKNI